MSSNRDVAAPRNAPRKLERSVSLLEATLDATADGILVIDRDGRIGAYNRQFLDLWRLPPALTARGDDGAMLSFVSEQSDDPKGFVNGVRDRHTPPDQEVLDVLRLKDGRVFERHSRPQRVDGEIAGRVWSFRDVTERERLLSRATFLADASRLLSSLDVERSLRGVAHLAVPYLGERCAVDLIRGGRPKRLLVYPAAEDRERTPELHAAALGGRALIYSSAAARSHIAVPLLCRDTVAGVFTFVAPRGREYTKTDLGLAEELGARVALAIGNARLYEGAREAVAGRDQLLSVAANQMRRPLRSIHLAARALSRESLGPADFKTALEIIQRENRRLGRVVDELLDLERIRTGQLHFDLENVDLSTIVRDVVSRLAGDFAQAGSEVSVRTNGDLVGHWDRLRLGQAVANIISNAIKFGEGKPIDVMAALVNGRARVTVVDRGIGIEPQRLNRIFDPFERAIDGRPHGGLGLGLHIAKTIIDGLGGTLTVDSRLAAGATFVVDLPASRAAQPARPANSRRR